MTTATLVDTGRAHVAHRPRSRKRRGLRWLWLPTFVVATGGLWVVLRAPARSSSPTQPVRLRAVPLGVSALGRLAPEGEVIAVVPGSVADGGRVDRLLVAVGDRVTAGQVMAILDPHRRRVAAVRQAQAQVEVARAKLAQAQAGPKPDDVRVQEALIERNHAEFRAAERDLGRASFLLKKAASSRQEFDDQSLKYEQARESLDPGQGATRGDQGHPSGRCQGRRGRARPGPGRTGVGPGGPGSHGGPIAQLRTGLANSHPAW